MMALRRVALLALLLGTPAAAAAQELSAAKHTDPAPPEVTAAIAPLLADGGVRVKAGATTLDFWWVKSIPLSPGSPGPAAWAQVAEGTLVGVVRLSSVYADIRGNRIKAGVYTLRFALQPQNGNHLGVSPYREFLLMSPAAADTDPAARGHDATIDLSKQAIGMSHPASLSLDPPETDAAPLSLKKDADVDLTAVIFSVPAALDGKAAGMITFGLVLAGKIEG